MRRWISAVIIFASVVTILLAVIGLLASWGIWIKSDVVKAGKALPHVGTLVTIGLLSFVNLTIQLGRSWFLARKAMEELPALYLEMLSVAIVILTDTEDDADANFTMLLDHFNNSYAHLNEGLKYNVREDISQAIVRMKSIRYGGKKVTKEAPEVLPKS